MTRETQGARVPRDTQSARVPRDTQSARVPRETQGARVPRDTQGARGSRDTQGARETRAKKVERATWAKRAACAVLMAAACGEGSAVDEGRGGAGGDRGTQASEGYVTSPREAVDLDPAPDVVRVALRAAPANIRVGDDEVDGFAYEGQVPGPTIRAKVGDRVVVELENALPDPTTLHWHGLHVPNAMDGATWLTQPVPAGGRFTYEFVVDRPGTFWYHPHHDEHEQVDRGLYGAFVVEDPAEPRADELVLVLDAWGEKQLAGRAPDTTHGDGSLPKVWTVNGSVGGRVRVQGGKPVRVRLLNASITGYAWLGWWGLRQIGSDQGLLPAPIEQPRVLLGPGDRVEAEWLVGGADFGVTSRPYSLAGGEAAGHDETLLVVEVDGPAAPPAPLALPYGGGAPSADPGRTDVLYVLTGSDEGGAWLINGEAYPNVTVSELPLGADVVFEVRNLSSTEHPFHLHGMPFEVLSIDGEPPAARSIEDTLNVEIGQVVRLLVRADNPGDWMAHCHILPHVDGGMMAVVRVK